MPNGRWRHLVSPLVWTLYAAIPVAEWGWMDGIPVGVLEAAAIALIWWVWASHGALPGSRILAALVIVKLLSAGLLVDRGFLARYYANDAWIPPVERSIEFRGSELTRRDEEIEFGGAGQPDLPLHFLNDLRFNFYGSDQPQRDHLAYSVIWDGFIRSASGRSDTTLYLITAGGVRGDLILDQRPTVAVNGATEQTASIRLAPGWHSLTIRVAAPYGSGRRVEAGEIVEGVRRPFDGRSVFIAPVSRAALATDAIIRPLTVVVDVLVLSWLGTLVIRRAREAWREVRVGRLLWLVAILEALVFARPYVTRLAVLTGGDDWLVYEHLARAIVGDPLLRERGMAGQGEAFYFPSIAYPYFLAVTHLVFGDGIFGVALVQRLLLAATAGWVGSLAARLFGALAGWTALIGGGVFLYAKAGPWSDVLLGEPLFMPLLVGWSCLLVWTAGGSSSSLRLVATGLVGGIATLTRTTLLLALPLVLPAWAAALRRSRVRSAVIVGAVTVAVLGTVALRSRVVSGTFTFVPTVGTINIRLGNEPPPSLTPPPAERQAVYDLLRLDVNVRAVAEYAVQQPTPFLTNLGRKALYSIGLFGLSGIQPRGGAVPDVSLFYVAVWCAALAGAVRLRHLPRRDIILAALPGLIALGHFAAMVVFFPNVYGDRLILPMYPLLIPYAALGAAPAVLWVKRNVSYVAPALGAVLVFCIFLPPSSRSFDAVALLIIVLVILVTAGTALPAAKDIRPDLGHAVILLAIWFFGSREDMNFRAYLLLPIAAVAVRRLARYGATHRVILTALVVGPFLTRDAFVRFASSQLADPFRWVVVGIIGTWFALLTRSQPVVRRRWKTLGAASFSVALLLPFLPVSNADVLNQLADMRRGYSGVTAWDASTRQQLVEDVRTVAEDVAEPFVAVLVLLTGDTAVFSVVCLASIWIQAIVPRERRFRPARAYPVAASYVGPLAAVVAVLTGSPAALWGGPAYSAAALAILLGLTRSPGAQVGDTRVAASVS